MATLVLRWGLCGYVWINHRIIDTAKLVIKTICIQIAFVSRHPNLRVLSLLKWCLIIHTLNKDTYFHEQNHAHSNVWESLADTEPHILWTLSLVIIDGFAPHI